MVIVYCETCGKRVPPADVNAGLAVQTGENLWLCGSCAAQGNALPDTQTAPAVMPSTQSAPRISPVAGSTTRQKSGGHPSTGSTVRRGTQVAHAAPPSVPMSTAKQFMLGAGAAALLLGVVLFLFTGKKPKPDTVAEKPPETKASNTPPTPPTPPKTTQPETKAETKRDLEMPMVNPDAGKTAEKGPITTPPVPPKQSGGDPGAITPAQLAQMTPAERQKLMDKEMEDYRTNRAQRLLDDHKAWFKQNASDPWTYQSKLKEVAGPYGSTPAGIEARKLLDEMKSLPPPPDRLEAAAPDSKEYTLVYDLDLSKLGKEIAYEVDNRAAITKSFNRIAYFIELDNNYLFVSMEAFTSDLAKIGVPTIASDARFQQKVANMNVASNVNGIVSGTGITGGNIEFWPNNYGPNNGNNIPDAASDKYDFGDVMSEPKDGYGCMQVHNHAAKQTLFAVNHWSTGGGADLGIGNGPGGNTDWTFTNSASNYRSKRLRVLVRMKQ